MPGFIAKNKKPLFIVSLFVVLFWLITLQVKAGRFTFMEKPVLAVSGAVERIFTGSFNAVASVGKRYLFLVGTQRENTRLREELGRLVIDNATMNELRAENERLRDALNFKRQQPSAAVMAEVIGRESSPSSITVTINRGSHDGIGKGNAVITPEGVVGKIEAVLPGTSKVILLTDPRSTLAVRVTRNREDSLLEGKLRHCALKYVSYYADIQEGDLLVTSGLDGIYPKGLPVAKVIKVAKHEAITFQNVVADPTARLSRLEEVLVLTQ